MAARSSRTYFIGISIAFSLFLLAGYALFEARFILLGPKITIEAPQNGDFFSQSEVTVSGHVENIVRISLNDRPIFIDEEGHFNEKLLVQKGYTIITVKAEDRFGREIKKHLYIARN
ncbi:MAG TPA: hypothetical protein VJH21_02035 [Candidatus Paceibacterota bacterium]